MNRSLFAGIAAMLLAGQSLLAAETGRWKLQDNAASTTVVATTGNNGTLTNAGNTSAISQADGPGTALTRSLSLNASDANDIITINHSMSGSGNRSACLWVKLNAVPANAATKRYLNQDTELIGLIGDHANANYRGAAYHAPNSYPYASLGGVTALTSGTWIHLAQTYDGANIRAYQNGVLQATSGATATAGTDATSLHIGNKSGSSEGARAFYCDVRVFSHCLTTGELTTIMAEKDLASVIDPISISIPGSSADPLTGTIPGL